jgi:hypothetical protein
MRAGLSEISPGDGQIAQPSVEFLIDPFGGSASANRDAVVPCFGGEVSTESDSDRVIMFANPDLLISADPVATALGTDSITRRKIGHYPRRG